MIFGRRRRAVIDEDPVAARRGGPHGEARWWDVADQRWAQSTLLDEADLGRGWRRFRMMNNVERLDPYGSGPDADALRAVRDARHLTALDEGAAWRRREHRVLCVARFEVYTGDDHDHRAAWQAHGRACLDETFRDRWRERDRTPGWIEARWLDDDEDGRPTAALGEADAAVDWLRVEDHTGSGDAVTVYEHVTVWCGRLTATLTFRRDLALDIDEAVVSACRALVARAAETAPTPGDDG